MEFSQHAIKKLNDLGLTKSDVEYSINLPVYELIDMELNSEVIITNIKHSTCAVVLNETGSVITVYKTELKTVENRIESGRWKCK